MSIVQTEYPRTLNPMVAGQIADTSTCDIDNKRVASGSANIPFGYAVRESARSTTPRTTGGSDSPATFAGGDVVLGVARVPIAMASSAVNAGATTLNVDTLTGAYSGGIVAGSHIVHGSEILYVSAVDGGALTVVRGAMGSTAAAISNNAEIAYLDGHPDFAGVAVMDERLPGSRSEEYAASDPCSVLWRGDVAVPVSAAVAEGAHVVVTITASSGDPAGSFSARAVDANHVLIPGANFRRASRNNISVVRLTGQHRNAPAA